MDWNKKIYPKDVWKWIKKPLNFIDILLFSDKSYHNQLIEKIRKRKKTYNRTKGGFTPRRSISRVDRAYFDINDFFDDLEGLNYLDEREKWAIHNYNLAESTGLWSTNMADGPVIVRSSSSSSSSVSVSSSSSSISSSKENE